MQQMQDAALPLFFTGDEYMNAQWYSEELWHRMFPAIGNRTAWSVVAGPKESDPVVRDNLHKPYSERLMEHMLPWLTYGKDGSNPELIHYWAERGIRKEIHSCSENPDRTWVAYLPEHAVQLGLSCPIWFINHAKGRDLLDIECWGFVQLVAEKQIIVLTVEEGNSEEIVWQTILEAARQYPVDLSRVYMVGHSFSGSVSGRIVIANPERYAGVCMLGSQYSGLDSTKEQIDNAMRYRMPRIDVHGTAEKILPLNQTSGIPASPRIVDNVTPTDMGAEACYAEQCLWRKLNCCEMFEWQDTADIQQTSGNIVEQKIGTILQNTHVRVLGMVPHYIGDVLDHEGFALFRHVGVEGAPHYPSAYCAELAWEFLHGFSRDTQTGELLWYNHKTR